MAVEVNGPEDLAYWAESKACNDRRRTGACEHEGCPHDMRAAELLSTLVAAPQLGAGVWTMQA